MIGDFSNIGSIVASSNDPVEVARAYRAYAQRRLAFHALLRCSDDQIAALGIDCHAIRGAMDLCS